MKAILIIGGEPKEFTDIQEARAYAKEHGITDINVINLDVQSLKREIPYTSIPSIHNYEIPTFVPMSGQESRRARRAAERTKKKKK